MLLVLVGESLRYVNETELTVLFSDDTLDSPQVNWTTLETQFGLSDADCLILLDCYHSTSTKDVVINNVTEIISGAGFGCGVSAARRYFFTYALCEMLVELSSGPPFSAAMLHQHVFARVHNRTAYTWPRSEIIPEYTRVDTSMTPMYGTFKSRDYQRSIALANNSAGLSKLINPCSKFQLSLTAPCLTVLCPTTARCAVHPFESLPEPLRVHSLRLRTLFSLKLKGHSSSGSQVQEMVDILSQIPLVKLEKIVPIHEKPTIPFIRPNASEFLVSMPIGYRELAAQEFVDHPGRVRGYFRPQGV